MTQLTIVCIAFVALLCLAYWLAWRDDKATEEFRRNLYVGCPVYYTFNRLPKQGRVVKIYHEYVHIKDSADDRIYSVAKKHVYKLK